MRQQPTPRILVIDNDEGLIQAITTRLRGSDYECVTAGNGEEGLAEYSMGGIDLVISDLNMPTLDGIGFIERVRAASSVPIIVMTGFSNEYRERVGRIPNVTLLQKPFETQALLDLVEVELAQRVSGFSESTGAQEA